ncbi:hypothetical protein G6M89_02395 [Natronolimnobius sp. AArcel1]|uniref:hypothetical protein n=1 Tax=Natronolimnobius sp. AArcel1 TaxID=1679093 RepID=UPI0013EAA844|nr:hypothetical protein [Natronolimnobius sp. AArcel1]NGM67870.1 hypothetical protein [Natronolimnobius sp. AArcel1]
MNWESDSHRAMMKLDIALELYKRSHWDPYSVLIDDLETFSEEHADEKCRELVAEVVEECDAIDYANRSETRIQLTNRSKPQDYIEDLNKQNDWYK